MAARNGISARTDAELREVALNYAVTYAHVNQGDRPSSPEEVVATADVYAKYLIDGTVSNVNPAF